MGFKDDLNFEFHKDIFCKKGLAENETKSTKESSQ
jgi:hypothetical protein